MMLPSEGEEFESVVECEEHEEEQVQHLVGIEEQLPQECKKDEMQITLHALSGRNANNTIRVQGTVNHKPLSILIDSGSTGNFLDTQAAKRLKVKLTNTNTISVYVVDGFKVSRLKFAVILPGLYKVINSVLK